MQEVRYKQIVKFKVRDNPIIAYLSDFEPIHLHLDEVWSKKLYRVGFIYHVNGDVDEFPFIGEPMFHIKPKCYVELIDNSTGEKLHFSQNGTYYDLFFNIQDLEGVNDKMEKLFKSPEIGDSSLVKIVSLRTEVGSSSLHEGLYFLSDGTFKKLVGDEHMPANILSADFTEENGYTSALFCLKSMKTFTTVSGMQNAIYSAGVNSNFGLVDPDWTNSTAVLSKTDVTAILKKYGVLSESDTTFALVTEE